MAYPPRRRPLGVIILAALVILGGVILTLLALLATLISFAVFVSGAGAILFVASLILLILSLLLLAAGFGLYNLRPWAWWLAVIVLVLVLVRTIGAWYALRPPLNDILVPIVIPALILIYLLSVRGYFRQPAYAYPYAHTPPR